MMTWDKSVDLVIVGSGGGGLVAAMAMIDEGLEPLVLEKQTLVGGSTGLSGGVVWMPNNPLMRAEGVADSHADGLAYFEAVVGDVGPASSSERRVLDESDRPISVWRTQAIGTAVRGATCGHLHHGQPANP